jgi:3-dehydroquinate synthase
MGTIRQSVEVAFEYPVHFTRDIFAPDNPLLRHTLGVQGPEGPRGALLAVDDGVVRNHPGILGKAESCLRSDPSLRLAGPPLSIQGGEVAKNDPANVARIHEAIDRHGLDRQSFVIAVGGGAVLDAVGYAAATAHRGVRLIRLPTTVLSQNDSGVGVKNGVNAYGKKNFIGTFAPPYAVINDGDFLTTLSDRDWLSGASEAVKVALLKDPGFFAWLEAEAASLVLRDLPAMERLVYRCAELHLMHIATSGDPFEFGSSRPLDFGHWSAHKLEQLTDFELRHGEAVAIGIALDTTYAYLSGMLAESDWRRVLSLFEALRLPIYHPALLQHLGERGHPRSVLAGLEEFREHLGGRLTIMLLRGIGNPLEVNQVDEQKVIEAIGLLESGRARKGVAA